MRDRLIDFLMRLFGKRRPITVIVEWNNDADGAWIEEEDRPVMPEDDAFTYPLSVYGPFDNFAQADVWMQDALPDNMDVLDMYSTKRAIPKGWPIASPAEYPDGYWRPPGQNPEAVIGVVVEAPMPIFQAGKV